MKRCNRIVIFVALWMSCAGAFGEGLEIVNPGTKLAHITQNGKPLLAFGCHLEHMFFNDNSPDYSVWSKWAQAHGVNHCRVRIIQPLLGDTYLPYREAGDGKYDLTQFNPVFWDRFREICVNLRDHGVVMHMLVFPHNQHVRSSNWRQSLFNPANNVNPETAHLAGAGFYNFWHSVADGQDGLWGIQRAALEKMVELTADLDNVYYDLSHEFRTDCCGAQPTDWDKAHQFFDTVADTIRAEYAKRQPGKKPLIGLDAEHFHKVPGQREWNFGNPKFDLMILGNSTTSDVPPVEQVVAWREEFKKPFLLQEGSADNDEGGKQYISYHGVDPAIVRKYTWKWMMAKNQMIGFYQKMSERKGYNDNYDPFGYSTFEKDALVLRAFWDALTDYPNLDYVGKVAAGPGYRKMVLSSEKEALAYLASKMGEVGTKFAAQELRLEGLALTDGTYTASVWNPEAAAGGLVASETCTVASGAATLRLPAFTDDLAVHFHLAAAAGPRAYRRTDVVAGRAGRAEHPETTMYGYERNLEAGVSLDMDIRKTADGDIVVLHDRTTGRTCDKDWVVAEKTVAELKTLDVAHHFDPRGDGSFPLRGQGITIPTLDEALALFAEKRQPDAEVWIDTKDDETSPFEENQGLYDRLIALIGKHDLWDAALVEVSATKEADALRQRDARIRIVFWAPDAAAVREALPYPHYLRIGVRANVAAALHEEIRAAGKEIFIALQSLNEAEMRAVEESRPDSVGAYPYSRLLALLGL